MAASLQDEILENCLAEHPRVRSNGENVMLCLLKRGFTGMFPRQPSCQVITDLLSSKRVKATVSTACTGAAWQYKIHTCVKSWYFPCKKAERKLKSQQLWLRRGLAAGRLKSKS